MKILFINVDCGIGSTGRICTDLAEALEEEGHQVKIAYGRDVDVTHFSRYAVKIGNKFSVYLHVLLARILDYSGFGSKRETKKFIKWIKNYNPDIIHLHNLHGYYINIDILFQYLKTSGKRIIWTLHDCWAFTGHSAYCDAVNCHKWENGCFSCPKTNEYPKSFLDRSKQNWIHKQNCFIRVPNMTLVSPSNWLAKLVGRSFLKEYPIKVIHNGIDTKKFYPMENDFRQHYKLEEEYLILGVSNVWNKEKGLNDFINLSDKIPDTCRIVMVGLNDIQIKNLPPNILGIKKTNSVKELSYIYSACDVFLNLTYCDNYPTTNLEARLCGLPIITYETGGSPESAGKDAIVVKKGDVDNVVNQIMMLQKTEFKHKMDKTADKKLMTDDYKILYRGGYFEKKDRVGLLSKYIILSVASVWDQRKGLSDIIKLSELIDDDDKIIIIGINKKQRKYLFPNILAIERTNNINELREWYALSDIVINPTLEDNYPTTNLEAASCGTPVLTYHTGGSPESVPKDNVVETNNVSGIQEKLRERKRKVSDINIDKTTMITMYKQLYAAVRLL